MAAGRLEQASFTMWYRNMYNEKGIPNSKLNTTYSEGRQSRENTCIKSLTPDVGNSRGVERGWGGEVLGRFSTRCRYWKDSFFARFCFSSFWKNEILDGDDKGSPSCL